MRGPGWKYPDRKRCLRCRSYFGFLVLDGLFDSYVCAGLPVPPLDSDRPIRPWSVGPAPTNWPREHFAMKWGRYRAKLPLPSREAAILAAEQDEKNAYICSFCAEWHIGGAPKR